MNGMQMMLKNLGFDVEAAMTMFKQIGDGINTQNEKLARIEAQNIEILILLRGETPPAIAPEIIPAANTEN